MDDPYRRPAFTPALFSRTVSPPWTARARLRLRAQHGDRRSLRARSVTPRCVRRRHDLCRNRMGRFTVSPASIGRQEHSALACAGSTAHIDADCEGGARAGAVIVHPAQDPVLRRPLLSCAASSRATTGPSPAGPLPSTRERAEEASRFKIQGWALALRSTSIACPPPLPIPAAGRWSSSAPTPVGGRRNCARRRPQPGRR